MNFYIQAGNPTSLKSYASEDCGEYFNERLSAMIQFSFPLWTEDLIIFWNREQVFFSYKYDIERIVPDMTRIIDILRSDASGYFEDTFGIQGYMPIWEFSWKNDILNLSWRDYPGMEKDRQMEGKPPLKMRLRQFIAEWKRPMKVCLQGMIAAGFNQIYPETISQFRKFISSLPGNGFLYVLEDSPPGYLELEYLYDALYIRIEGETVEIYSFENEQFSELICGVVDLIRDRPSFQFTSAIRYKWNLARAEDQLNLRIIENNGYNRKLVISFLTTLKHFANELFSLLTYLKETNRFGSNFPDSEYNLLSEVSQMRR